MTSTVYVHTRNGKTSAWSRYEFPFTVEAFAQLGNDLYIRNGDVVSKVVEGLQTDYYLAAAVPFAGAVQWPWLDFGLPGATKRLKGFDLVASGVPSVSIGYDQRNPATFTTPYVVSADTLPGGIIAFPIMAPTFSFRVDFAAGTAWSLHAATLYVSQSAGQP